ncbi:carbohydrate/purine kinase [Grosmannia clavigera kw1407]|uniref:Carbohydrate/purine kinase n=1 Tax=Grosmannia clavigera (strain kw1407 / UAMH 11150) TaxID=655863 RepID=F0XEY3_GROCL|nr:carbohydrate/purine kinase [Grosmannia clavigera kw1407]EFX03987.1 carbohydrate/purine kinase [Grosmannia clavigera kw1407]
MASYTAGRVPAFVSLGMVVVDELRSPGKTPRTNIPGGSGTFSTFGARLVSGRDQAADVGCFILAGSDFPQSVLDRLEEWDIDLTVKVDPTRLSTRGLLEYHDAAFSRKTFHYTTTPLQPTPKDLPLPLLAASSFHLLAGPADLERQVGELLRLRSQSRDTSERRPLLVWEPLPIQVSAAAREAHLAACRLVHVFSPNHLELIMLFQGPVSPEEADDAAFRTDLVEAYADAVLDAGIGPDGNGTIVVRAGSRGCLVSSTQIHGRHRWLPAVSFAHGSRRAVVDATGAGNTFLGALTFAMASHDHDVLVAARQATVAASFAIEQIGLATLERPADGQEEERWNGQTFGERFKTHESMQLL